MIVLTKQVTVVAKLAVVELIGRHHGCGYDDIFAGNWARAIDARPSEHRDTVADRSDRFVGCEKFIDQIVRLHLLRRNDAVIQVVVAVVRLMRVEVVGRSIEVGIVIGVLILRGSPASDKCDRRVLSLVDLSQREIWRDHSRASPLASSRMRKAGIGRRGRDHHL